jgi:predicted ribosome quality control (RQC) complex YloA/Tae2 family protein
MSNGLREDSLLIRYLAAELDDRLRGRYLERLALDPARRIAVLEFDGAALRWHLQPMAGWITAGRAEVTPELVDLARRTRIRAVRAPADERILILELSAARRQAGRPVRIIIELLGNQWNLVAVGPDERIVAVLWRRSAGGRELRPGHLYEPPPPGNRHGTANPLALEEWLGLLGDLPPAERTRCLISTVAYTSPINAAAILGNAGRAGEAAESVDRGLGGSRSANAADLEALTAAHARYVALAEFPAAAPRLLELAAGPQPYPLPLPGVADTPFPTLLAAMAAMAGEAQIGAEGEAVPVGIPLELLDRLRTRIRWLERRHERLTAQLSDKAESAVLHRHQADLLIGQLYLIKKGMTEAEIPDWEGGTVRIELDPALGPSENAERLYDKARRERRAAERVPPLLEQVSAERDRLVFLLDRSEAGEIGEEEISAALPAPAEPGRPGPGRVAAPLPYRRYRTSGGLEVRVGRGSKANDALTFHHSSPNDIWLHARDVAGAHVILRWNDAQSNPPSRDLTEAAVLASLHSRARSSGTVAVDWTRRKYVRKPRKSPPGLVVPDRARTLFVEPDQEIERRLRESA